MTSFSAYYLATLVAFAAPERAARADDGKRDHKLLGTWKLISAKYGGQDRKLREGYTHIKHVTPTHFMWATYDNDGTVDSALGGPYTVTGDKYEETPEYGVGEVLSFLKAKPQTFTWKVEGTKWYHTGKLSSGLTIEEVWERVEKK